MSERLAEIVAQQAKQIAEFGAELAEWRKLRDPANLHVNLLRGLPAQLTREQRMHLAADDLQRMAELEAVAKHEADCAEAYRAEAEALRAAPWIGECQACGHQHEAKRPQPLTEEQRVRLFIELNSPCVQADSPSEMFTIIVQAVERAHGIGA